MTGLDPVIFFADEKMAMAGVAMIRRAAGQFDFCPELINDVGIAIINAIVRGVVQMDRRALVSGFLGFTVPAGLSAKEIVLGPATAMGTPTRTYVQNPVRIQQKCDQWCWAASISMIFANLGHDVPQTDIVSKVFGSLVCAPAGTGLTMAMALSDSWTDTAGVRFQSNVVAAYDQAAGVNAISNGFILDELSSNRALLYANKHHAMVVTAVDYFATPYGPNVQAVGVLDPWPYSPAFHALNPAEIIPAYLGGDMTFLAAVHI